MDQQQNNSWNEENSDDAVKQDAPEEQSSEGQQTTQQQGASGERHSEDGATSGVDEYKTLAIVGYILPFLFFLPLINEESKRNAYARFHANQHLIMLLFLLALYILHSIFFRMFFMGGYIIIDLINLAYVVFVILGIINAAKGEMKELPLIGSFQLLK